MIVLKMTEVMMKLTVASRIPFGASVQKYAVNALTSVDAPPVPANPGKTIQERPKQTQNTVIKTLPNL